MASKFPEKNGIEALDSIVTPQIMMQNNTGKNVFSVVIELVVVVGNLSIKLT